MSNINNNCTEASSIVNLKETPEGYVPDAVEPTAPTDDGPTSGVRLAHTLSGFVVSLEDLPVLVDPLLRSLSPISESQLHAAARRIVVHGHRMIKVVDTADGLVLVSGLEDYLACRFLRLEPALTTVATPADLPRYVLEEHVPRHVWKAQRAAMAALTVERYAEIARAGKIEKLRTGINLDEQDVRATTMAARAAQIGREAVDQALLILRGSTKKKRAPSPVVFAAMLDGSLRQMAWANRIATHPALDTEDKQAGAVRVIAQAGYGPGKDCGAVYGDYLRQLTAPDLKDDPTHQTGTNVRYRVLDGDLREVGAELPDRFFDRAFADPLWGTVENPDTCEAIARLWARVGKVGAIICFLPGLGDQVECVRRIAQHLTYVSTGNYRMTKYQKSIPGFLDRIEDMTLWYFCVGPTPDVALAGQSAVSSRPQVTLDVNQRHLGSITEILTNMRTLPGMKVLDPVCCTGTTLVAALKLGCQAVGIEREAARARDARGRCYHYETKGYDITEESPVAPEGTSTTLPESAPISPTPKTRKPKP